MCAHEGVDMTEPASPPIVCDMSDAPDTPEARTAAYRQLYADALVARERTEDGIRFRFRNDDGIERRVRELAALERACCAFISHAIAVHGAELWWEATTVDDPITQKILDEMYRLPDTIGEGTAALYDRFADQGLVIVTEDDGVHRPATRSETASR
jgi:hypothetical protein